MQSSYESIFKWIRVAMTVQPKAKLYLIRTKKDLENQVEHPVKYSALLEAKNKMGFPCTRFDTSREDSYYAIEDIKKELYDFHEYDKKARINGQ